MSGDLYLLTVFSLSTPQCGKSNISDINHSTDINDNNENNDRSDSDDSKLGEKVKGVVVDVTVVAEATITAVVTLVKKKRL